MKIQLKYLLLTFILISYGYVVNAQDIGTIYSKSEANQKFGTVIESFPMDKTTLSSLMAEAGKYIMFNVKNKKVIILGQNRNLLYPKNITVSASEVFKVYSISKVDELIQLGGDSTTVIEYRDKEITLTNGNSTLENAAVCPPICH